MSMTVGACVGAICRCHACKSVLSPPLMICRRCNPETSSDSVQPVTTSGPGTQLKKLLKTWLRIEATPNCSCNARARTMDTNGCDWCEAHLEEIVGWLREEATKRGLPFVDMAGRVLVRRAISNARKEAARATQASNAEGSEAETR
jgi:hypothetical protein